MRALKMVKIGWPFRVTAVVQKTACMASAIKHLPWRCLSQTKNALVEEQERTNPKRMPHCGDWACHSSVKYLFKAPQDSAARGMKGGRKLACVGSCGSDGIRCSGES
jgi:hypothetical protein